MESDRGFEDFSHAIESDPLGVLLAKWRRDEFIRKLERLPDVIEVIPSGSLTRGTHIGPVHDVDLIVVFDKSAHPDYGSEAESARPAMTYLENKLLEQLHPLSGTEALIKGTEPRTHVVNCHGGSTGRYAEFIPSAPPVDVMPAVRKEPNLLGRSPLLVPELGAGGDKWTVVDPETFMRQVEQRQREWKYFTEVIKMVKAWAELNHLDMKTVAIEVMVLTYCPRPRMFETLSRGEAIARFFEAADKARITSLKDPAGRCGEIDRKMNYGKLRSELKTAAGLARQAMDAECNLKNRSKLRQNATHPSVFWRKLFGKEYPKAREYYLRAPSWEPWFGKYQAKYAAAPDLGYPGPKPPPSDNPKRPPNDDPKRPPNDGPDGSGGRGRKGPDDLGPNGPYDMGPRGSGWRPGGFSGPSGGTRRARTTRSGSRTTNPRDAGTGSARPPGARPASARPASGRPASPSPASASAPSPSAPTASPAAHSASGPGRRPGPASAQPVTNVWTKVFGSAATVSVPLTFG
jgi:hypothetical protein